MRSRRKIRKIENPADIMPVYLWLMGDDSRRKTE